MRAALEARIPRWSKLRGLGNSLPARLTVLIPLVGYLILLNQWVVDYTTLFTDKEGTVSHGLFLIYLGLCFIALASTIYAWPSPLVIRRYASSAEYVRGDGPHLGDFTLRFLENTLDEPGATQYRQFKRMKELSVDRDHPELDARREVNLSLLHLFYAQENSQHPWLRLSTSIAYVIGFVLLLFPASVVFLKVIVIVSKALLGR